MALPKKAMIEPITMNKVPIIHGLVVRNLTNDVAEKIGHPRLCEIFSFGLQASDKSRPSFTKCSVSFPSGWHNTSTPHV